MAMPPSREVATLTGGVLKWKTLRTMAAVTIVNSVFSLSFFSFNPLFSLFFNLLSTLSLDSQLSFLSTLSSSLLSSSLTFESTLRKCFPTI